MRRFFITNITIACNATKMEEALAAELRQYVDCILSEKAMLWVKDAIEKKQAELKAANPRWRLADITINLKESTSAYYSWQYFRVGCSVAMSFREVKREFKCEGE